MVWLDNLIFCRDESLGTELVGFGPVAFTQVELVVVEKHERALGDIVTWSATMKINLELTINYNQNNLIVSNTEKEQFSEK